MIKKLLHSALFSTAALTASYLSADPQPYTNIRNLAYTPYYVENGYILINLINSIPTATFIDVGSQDGSAARYVAQNTQDIEIYAVNSWWSCDPYQANLFQRFLSNVKQENTAEKIIPLRMSSAEGAKALDVIADVIYLGYNSQKLSNEIVAWSMHLSSNGIICGKDWDDPSIETSVSQAALKLGSQVHTNGGFWYLQKE